MVTAHLRFHRFADGVNARCGVLQGVSAPLKESPVVTPVVMDGGRWPDQ